MPDRVQDECPEALIHAMQRIVNELRVTLHETAGIRRHAKDALRSTRIALARLQRSQSGAAGFQQGRPH